MLDSFATHSLIDLRVRAKGDLQHHLVEDVALAAGTGAQLGAGGRAGITRFGNATVPMDDSLALVAVDLVKRPYASVQLGSERVMVEDAPREDLEHFFVSLITSLGSTIHVKVLDGKNDHHRYEAAVKGLAVAFRIAATPDSQARQEDPVLEGQDVSLRFLIFNYGAGNLFSIQSALRKEGVTPSVTKTGAGMDEADAFVLPGVGSFDQACGGAPDGRLAGPDQVWQARPGRLPGLQLFFADSEEGIREGLLVP